MTGYLPEAMIADDIAGWLRANAEKSMLRFITCGSVDDGKSTLIGRLLYDTRQIFDDQLSALHADSARVGTRGSRRCGTRQQWKSEHQTQRAE